VHRAHDVRPREREQVDVSAQVARVVAEPLAAVIRLGQLIALDQGAGRAVENEDPLGQQGPEQRDPLLTRSNRPGLGRRRFG
jgi:hypothetical protein